MMTWLTISEHCVLKIPPVTSVVPFSFLHLWIATQSSDVTEVLTCSLRDWKHIVDHGVPPYELAHRAPRKTLWSLVLQAFFATWVGEPGRISP